MEGIFEALLQFLVEFVFELIGEIVGAIAEELFSHTDSFGAKSNFLNGTFRSDEIISLNISNYK